MSKTAFLFPGQGSQSVGMLASFSDQVMVKQTFQEASGALGYDVWSLIQDGPDEVLNQTDKTQPLLLTAGVALWRLWQQRGAPRPDFLAGHSLGEYSALVCAGVLSLGDGVRLVQTRGQLMQAAVPAGAGKMAAVLGLDDEQVHEICMQAAQEDVVEAVNYNAPGQVVIAGHAVAVERAIEMCKAIGAKRAMPLSVSVPSHCALMKPAAEQLAEIMKAMKFHAAEIPVINNVDVEQEQDIDRIRAALVRQLYSPVRWTETVRALQSLGVTHAYECGPGKVLAGLAKRIDRRLSVQVLETAASFEAALIGQGLGQDVGQGE